jgi:hypothetical protein
MNIWIEKNIADWPNKSAGPDLKEALKAPELEKFMKYHDKLANWSALTSTRKDCENPLGCVRRLLTWLTDVMDVFAGCRTASFKGASAKVKSMRESKHWAMAGLPSWRDKLYPITMNILWENDLLLSSEAYASKGTLLLDLIVDRKYTSVPDAYMISMAELSIQSFDDAAAAGAAPAYVYAVHHHRHHPQYTVVTLFHSFSVITMVEV